MIRTFDKVTRQCHPAAQDVFAYLESIAAKDKKAFAASFGSVQLFANLPGGVQVKEAKKLIEMHDDFFESPVSKFEYGELTQGVGGSDFFTCSVPANVTLPDGSKRRVCIDMTFLKNPASQPSWTPARLINTVVDSSQAVLR
jgi:hypothetical protein